MEGLDAATNGGARYRATLGLSDNLIAVKVMTATEASRSFAVVLDEAERGETIVVTRGGRRIAVIGPAPTAPGRMVKAFLARSAGSLDADFESDVAAARDATDDEMRDAWPDA
ncbi:type II toxin-antitoxin system Phd/YefM family antitoxin [Sphaerimonospora thailandensis]|uniref:type II toxin-antitoxin system Phd/YefM family antitoxin n=1 Tax=Sphaerimonospora thailandensis TaxID=795644 RepID=UPI001EF1CC91|nr:type II toxin-antitoxin system prevent-host-death family antitoxin [Sphaerimonospora thailandensis]